LFLGDARSFDDEAFDSGCEEFCVNDFEHRPLRGKKWRISRLEDCVRRITGEAVIGIT
jgi:hypothetical protein